VVTLPLSFELLETVNQYYPFDILDLTFPAGKTNVVFFGGTESVCFYYCFASGVQQWTRISLVDANARKTSALSLSTYMADSF
jgi:hypothetical protein